MLEVDLTSHRGCMATESGRSNNEENASTASEAFARWLHIQYVSIELPSARCYAKRGTCRRRVSVRPSVCLCVRVCHTPVLCENG